MICNQCNFINPRDNQFCQNCGSSLHEPVATEPAFEPMHVPELPAQATGLKRMVANTTDNKSYVISRSRWDIRMDFFLPFVLLAAASYAVWQHSWGSAGVLVFGFLFAGYKAATINRIVQKTIPVELIGKVIIAYGAANTKGRLYPPSGVLYLLSEGLYYKSYSDKDAFAFVHVNRSTAATAELKKRIGWIRDWEEVQIRYDSGETVFFTVYAPQTWLMMISLVCSEALRDKPQEMLVDEVGQH